MSNIVLREDEVMLYGQRFPISGTIRRTAVTPFAPKFVIGDYTRDDQIIASSWILSTFAGGLGVQHATLPRDADRFRMSTLESRYRELTLGAKVYVAGSLTGAAKLMMEYAEQLYVVIDSNVYRWSETEGEFDYIKTLSGTPTAHAVYQGELFILTTEGLYRYSSITNVWKNYVTGYKPSGYALAEWDGKLFRLGLDNKMYWTIDPDQNNDGNSVYVANSPTPETNDWEVSGILHLPPGYCRQLIVYFDLTGEPALHAITRGGVYGYDFAAHKFYETPLTYPVTDKAGYGAMVFRGELFVIAGKMGYKYNGSTIQVISPSKDEGLPSELQGNILQLVPGHAFYYAVMEQVTTIQNQPTQGPFFDPSNPLDPHVMDEAVSYGAVLASPGMAWHMVFNERVGPTMGASLVASIEGTFRLWISSEEGIYYVPLDTGLHNPLQNPLATFKDFGYLETGWADLGWTEVRKLALEVSVVAEASPTEPINIYAGWDDDEGWELVATVTSSGHHQFNIGGIAGKVFRNVRFRIEMFSTESDRRTPILRQMVFAFMRRPPMLWGWEINIMFTKDLHAGKTHEELLNFLQYVAEYTKQAGEFIYRDRITGGAKTNRVVIGNIQGAESPGDDAKARYTVSLIQLDTPTAQEEDEYVPTY